VCFMVDNDQCLMEAVEPRIVWIRPMGYEVDEKILELHIQHLLSQPKDPKAERFGTYLLVFSQTGCLFPDFPTR